jgi:hypothetical protein
MMAASSATTRANFASSDRPTRVRAGSFSKKTAYDVIVEGPTVRPRAAVAGG